MVASIVNISLGIKIGRVKTPASLRSITSYNFLFGIIISAISAILLLTYTPLTFLGIFTESNTDLMVNLGRFFLLSGMAVFLLYIPSTIKTMLRPQETVQSKTNFGYKILHWVQLVIGIICFYMYIAINISIGGNPQNNTLANFILTYALLLTSLSSFGVFFQKNWLKN